MDVDLCSSGAPPLSSLGVSSRHPLCASLRRPLAGRQLPEEESPNATGLQMPRRIPGRRSMTPTQPNGLGAAAVASWVAVVEDVDGGLPASEKNGGAPQRATIVPAVKLG
jgi:hypothetical protein